MNRKLLFSFLGIWASLLFGNPAFSACQNASGFRHPLDTHAAQPFQDFAAYLGIYRGKAYNGYHGGEDWSASIGTPVRAMGAGRVVRVSPLGGGLGSLVAIEYTGSFTIPGRSRTINGKSYTYNTETVTKILSVYMHITPQPGLTQGVTCVVKGQQVGTIANISSSGLRPHLHFEIRHPNQTPSNNWSLVGNISNWQKFPGDGYNGYYIDPQPMVDANSTPRHGGLRDPTDFLAANPSNRPPTITSLTANPPSVPVNGQSTISVKASDPDGDSLTYAWSATCGTLSGTSNADPKTWTAPGTLNNCTVSVTVTDPFGAKAMGGVGIPVTRILVFTSNQSGNYELYKINSDGTGLTNLTQNPADDLAFWDTPWSPDGSHIAFVSTRVSPTQIYVMNPDGSGQAQVTSSTTDFTRYPAWSPDGQKLAFTDCAPSAPVCAIETINLNGTNDQILVSGQDPRWSVLNRIAFEIPQEGIIGILNPDGTGRVTIDVAPATGANNRAPRWSPDGKKLVFVWFDPETSQARFYTVGQDGKNLTKILDFGAVSVLPGALAWSPDGKQLAFSSIDGGLYIVNADGTGLQNVTPGTIKTTGGTGDVWPRWSPDGKKLAFFSDRNSLNATHDIFVINIDGTGLQNLTNSPSKDDSYPFWKP